MHILRDRGGKRPGHYPSARFPHRRSKSLRYLVALLLSVLTWYLLTGADTPLSLATPWAGSHGGKHPIDALVRAADKVFAARLSMATQTLPATAAAYRERRGRHPPPGFDKWYAFAREKKVIVVEEFWDQIYHDLEPFWGARPAQIRKDAREFEMRVQVRDGKASTGSDWFWTQIWLNLIQSIEHLLPDMDLALNPMDEPRVVVPWEDMAAYLKEAAKTKKMAPVKKVVSDFSKLPPIGETPYEEESVIPPVAWERNKHYWPIARRGCPPNSPARQAETITDFDKTPFIASSFNLAHMKDGYVANYTLSTDFCHQDDLQALEGVFVEPLTVASTTSLLPIFGGSKLSTNNDILLPAPMYWNEEERFTGGNGASVPWSSKYSSVVWRGVATGGLNRATNWRSFQRHRFVAMNNATMLSLAASNPTTNPPPNFALPSKQYPLPPLTPQANDNTPNLPSWLSQTTDVAFTDLMCAHKGFHPSCNYTGPFFSTTEPIPMAAQFAHKYLPDIDGNSFSGRYLGFLRSTSVPVKAALWREWHDARLVAWKHFVPMDNRFGDWWGILGYFLGGGGSRGVSGGKRGEAGRDRGDLVGERIAMAGRDWAGKVLRKEDMAVYTLRLLLEYARVTDDRREVMGWVGDLNGEGR
ncbi:glycosyltransferase [Staphylotrichum tortipilum]|uniref:Glycosyltransferase n=1 Tax=Staphylotrichum tortipilum TaxID=2831512 RepID=A0AAN6MR61_9PEZI|nr:glycosyltransferase [Staphylotrichum longicolle]